MRKRETGKENIKMRREGIKAERRTETKMINQRLKIKVKMKSTVTETKINTRRNREAAEMRRGRDTRVLVVIKIEKRKKDGIPRTRKMTKTESIRTDTKTGEIPKTKIESGETVKRVTEKGNTVNLEVKTGKGETVKETEEETVRRRDGHLRERDKSGRRRK